MQCCRTLLPSTLCDVKRAIMFSQHQTHINKLSCAVEVGIKSGTYLVSETGVLLRLQHQAVSVCTGDS